MKTMRVLLVEDDADMAESLKASLTADDHSVDVAGDGELGQSMATNGGYDVIVLDRMLPKKLGYYRYPGSLTTPPCAETVEWLLLTTPITVAESDVAGFAKLYPLNARPVQRDNRRYVLMS